ncbi:MAG: hypothetical protein MUW56_01045 [Chryseobacterium sp.]|uniref:hypothetical protein n=1 Tax=Chryseobacterium sp. TaxID=1871047 RepID=UPI0025C1AC63|nr:hypothetical protein [Chryseobacterium sp.]MCJ7932239.1 hypothetical protein [Chryseobacterium sp.]
MKKQNLEKGKKLTKNELTFITGGLGNVRCTTSPGHCKYIGPGCAEPECQLPIPVDPIEIIEPGVL